MFSRTNVWVRNPMTCSIHAVMMLCLYSLRIYERTHPLGDAPRVRGAPALGPHFERHLVLLQLQIPVHAGHLKRRARHGAAELQRNYTRRSAVRYQQASNLHSLNQWSFSMMHLRVVCAQGGNDVPGLLPRPHDGEPAGEGLRRGAAALAGAAAAGAFAADEAGRRESAVLGDLREVARRSLLLLLPGEVELGRRLHLPHVADSRRMMRFSAAAPGF